MAEFAPTGSGANFSLGFAGDTFNTAWYLAQHPAGIDVGYFTAVGDDTVSKQMRSFISASGIDATHIRSLPGASVGAYLIHLNDGERAFSYWRDSSAARQLARDPGALHAAMAGVELIYFSGITLAILDPASRATLLSAVAKARTAGSRVAFDTNLRPKLWDSPAAMTQTVMEAAATADIVLPSFDDEATWFGDASPEATRDRYAALGVPSTIVKNSAGPVLFQQDGARGAVPVTPVANVVDTTAAGDSFNAGLLGELLSGASLSAAIASGCALARRVVQARGALVTDAFADEAGDL